MNKERSIKYLIASWGNPKAWQETRYKFYNESYESNTTLVPLYKHYKPSRLIIIVNDTLPELNAQIHTYQDLEKSVENNYKKLLDQALQINECTISILVIPANGNFRVDKNYSINSTGDINDAIGYLYYKLVDEFINDMNNYGDFNTLDIILDVTHGHNMLTLVTYTHLKKILSILAFKYKVKLTVHISDPVITGQNSSAKINQVECIELKRDIPIESLDSDGKCLLIKAFDNINNINESKTIGETGNVKEYEVNNCFVNSLKKGIPLAVYKFYPDLNFMEKKIKSVIDLWIDYIEIKNNTILEINRRLYLTSDFNNYVLIYLLGHVLNKLGITKKEEITLEDDFISLKDNVYKDMVIKPLIDRAIGEIKRLNNIPNDWRFLAEINSKRVGDFDHQNFFAHAGLEYNVTQIKKDNSKIWLRYDKSKESEIKGALKK